MSGCVSVVGHESSVVGESVEVVATVVTYATEDVLRPNRGCGVVSMSDGMVESDVRSTSGDGCMGVVRGSILVRYFTDAVCVATECMFYASPSEFVFESSDERGTE